MSDIGGSLFLAALAFIAGVVIALMTAGNPSHLDPTAAYCRGYSDAVVFIISQTEGRVLTDEQRDMTEAGCEQQVDADSVPPFARGPIRPE